MRELWLVKHTVPSDCPITFTGYLRTFQSILRIPELAGLRTRIAFEYRDNLGSLRHLISWKTDCEVYSFHARF